MKFLVELDHPKTGQPFTEDTARAFIESVIFPTLARARAEIELWRVDYNCQRPHRGINLEVPIPYLTDHEFKGIGTIKRADWLGGLIHEYRVAA